MADNNPNPGGQSAKTGLMASFQHAVRPLIELSFVQKIFKLAGFPTFAEVQQKDAEIFQLKAALRKKAQELEETKTERDALQANALIDDLTGLRNRTMFLGILEERIREIKEHGAKKAAVLFIDLDYFKAINDGLGHDAGDEALKFFGRLATGILYKKTDTVARISGDEFAILLVAEEGEVLEPKKFVERLRDEMAANPFKYDGVEQALEASIGIAVLDKDTLEAYGDLESIQMAQAILLAADHSMYLNKGVRQQERAAKAYHESHSPEI